MSLNLLVVGGFIGSFFWRMNRGATLPTSWGLVALSAAALAVLVLSGFLGGMLAYRYGVRVAGEATQVEGFR